jgi:E-phenylitaconyl-CoA hydratase
MSAGLRVEDTGAVRVLTIDRPHKRNALDRPAMAALSEALTDFAAAPELRVCVLTGAGDAAFCAGADIGDTVNVGGEGAFARSFLTGPGTAASDDYYLPWISIGRHLREKVAIAAVNGWAVGGGMELAVATDIRLGSPNARFSLPEASIGSIPALGTIARLRRALPASWVLELLLGGDPIDAQRACEVGLLSRVVAAEQLMDEAMDLARKIAAKAPLSVRAIKFLMRFEGNLGLDDAEVAEHLLWGLLAQTDDRAEGRRAFMDRRPPRYTGT